MVERPVTGEAGAGGDAGPGLGPRRVVPWLSLAPALTVTLLFVVALVDLLRWSVYPFAPPGVAVRPGLTLASYGKALGDSLYLGSLGVTFKLAVIATAASLLLGFPLAYSIVRTGSARTRALLIVLVAVPFMTSLIVRLYSLTLLLGNTGLINRSLQGAGLVSENAFVPLIRNQLGVAIGLTYFVLPFVVFTLTTVFRRLDWTLEEAAQNLGADEVVTFFRVTLPLSMPGVVGAAGLAFVLSVTAFATPLILGGSAVRMIANNIYDQILFVHNVPLGTALAVIALVVTAAVFYLQGRATGRGVA
jgi:ABC-type spermidine/putrescine transport system permease subunit I